MVKEKENIGNKYLLEISDYANLPKYRINHH